MKTLLAIFCIALFALSAKAQTVCVVPLGFVCLTQTDADKISADLAELKASRPVIAAFKAERDATAAQIASLNNLVKQQDALADSLRRQIVDMTTVHDLAMKTLAAYADLTDKLVAKLNAPKSAFAKFAQALKEIALIATGLAIGTHL